MCVNTNQHRDTQHTNSPAAQTSCLVWTPDPQRATFCYERAGEKGQCPGRVSPNLQTGPQPASNSALAGNVLLRPATTSRLAPASSLLAMRPQARPSPLRSLPCFLGRIDHLPSDLKGAWGILVRDLGSKGRAGLAGSTYPNQKNSLSTSDSNDLGTLVSRSRGGTV